MLQLKDIRKDYAVADNTVHALKGIDLRFRRNEFVSILGPSGCGKTTLLNIIGGLDHYTSGDLIICGKSTKAYQDRDWDTYRNHRIGFVFQSYNLIPHQNILSNVELALTIGGMSAAERKEKAREALRRVGLEEQLNKYPNQLSGGQMQRVAIARALVNDPEILLADEPTGALDTKTSVQIMELIKEIAQDRLVIMVTHNPELAEQYSTRIVRLLDGQVVEDSNPYVDDDATKKKVAARAEDKKKGKKTKEKSNMSFLTSLALSARNLWTKKGRTSVTAVAGSIGIIGVCLVLALSSGIHGYIDSMQDDMLSGNPITIRETGFNVDALTKAMRSMNREEKREVTEKGLVYIDSYISALAKMGEASASMFVTNDISQEYVDYLKNMPSEYYGAMTFDYGVDLLNSVYTDFTYTDESGQRTTKNVSVSNIQAVYTNILSGIEDYKSLTQYISMYTDIFAVAPNSADYIRSQYDVYGKVASGANEIMIVLNGDREISDLTMGQLGYLTQDQMMAYAYKAVGDEKYNPSDMVPSFTNDSILNKTFTWYPNDTIYTVNDHTDPTFATAGYLYHPSSDGFNRTQGVELKVVGVLQPKENISYGCLSSGVYYTQALAEQIVAKNAGSAIVSYAKEDKSGTVGGGSGSTYPGMMLPGSIMSGMGGSLNESAGIAYRCEYVYEGTVQSVPVLSSITARELGGENVPDNISIYPLSFELKSGVTDYLDAWNDDEAHEEEQITYTDSLEIIITMLNSMIDIVTYGLVAFTSISLVVSSVMIGVITYVSVVERTKEIGVLRSLGARKSDVSNLFNAETFIIGLLAGVFGVAITYLISIPANLILGGLTGIYTLVSLPIGQALIMICVSFALTMLSGLVPARAAAKKDPVIALRTE